MTKAPIIGITTYARDANNRFAVPAEYIDAVRRAGGIPILITPGEVQLDRLLEAVDGVVMTGGGDVDPARFGGPQHETIYSVDAERDEMEIALTKRIVAQGTPTLAICRGAQIVNVALGGTLHVHLPDVVGDRVPHRDPPRNGVLHQIDVDADSGLARLLGQTVCRPMSWHHQAIRDAAAPLVVVARAPDGVIEAVEMPDHPWLYAVQWHPELTAIDDPAQQRLFDELVRAAGNK